MVLLASASYAQQDGKQQGCPYSDKCQTVDECAKESWYKPLGDDELKSEERFAELRYECIRSFGGISKTNEEAGELLKKSADLKITSYIVGGIGTAMTTALALSGMEDAGPAITIGILTGIAVITLDVVSASYTLKAGQTLTLTPNSVTLKF